MENISEKMDQRIPDASRRSRKVTDLDRFIFFFSDRPINFYIGVVGVVLFCTALIIYCCIRINTPEDISDETAYVSDVPVETAEEKNEETESSNDEQKTVIMPDLIGMTVTQASEALTKVGLTAKASHEESTEYDKDYIVSQDVASGTEIESGTVINLVVSSGKAPKNEDRSDEWMDAYKRFLDDEQYLKAKEWHTMEFGEDYDPIAYALYDMDKDGIPELFIHNGAESYADSITFVFFYKDGEIAYFANLPGSSYNFRYGDISKYPGVFTDGAHTGCVWTDYYFKKGNELGQETVIMSEMDPDGTMIEDERTQDEELFDAHECSLTILDFVTENDYSSMGWSDFARKFGY